VSKNKCSPITSLRRKQVMVLTKRSSYPNAPYSSHDRRISVPISLPGANCSLSVYPRRRFGFTYTDTHSLSPRTYKVETAFHFMRSVTNLSLQTLYDEVQAHTSSRTSYSHPYGRITGRKWHRRLSMTTTHPIFSNSLCRTT
jgi:hypothetical protein